MTPRPDPAQRVSARHKSAETHGRVVSARFLEGRQGDIERKETRAAHPLRRDATRAEPGTCSSGYAAASSCSGPPPSSGAAGEVASPATRLADGRAGHIVVQCVWARREYIVDHLLNQSTVGSGYECPIPDWKPTQPRARALLQD